MSYLHLAKGMGARKKLGQNFLIDESVIAREVEYCKPDRKNILEIGPGLGALTAKLAERATHITAVEIDDRLVSFLKQRIKAKNLTLIQGDILEFSGGPFDTVVSNMPYYIASKILFKLPDIGFTNAILCIQAELADRIAAPPGSREYSRISVMCQMMFEATVLEKIPATAFYPKPKVESAILKLKNKSSVDEDMASFITAIFSHKNKKLRNAIRDSRKMLGLEKKEAEKLASSLWLKERRVTTLTKREVADSFREYSQAKD